MRGADIVLGMKPMFLVDHEGSWSLCMNAGDTASDAAIEAAGHEPNGYFWEGVAQILVQTEAKELASQVSYDPEGGMFCAVSEDKAVLEKLAAVMLPIANEPERAMALIEKAKEMNFEFDD